MNLEACLPAEFRERGATITPIAAGLSGAGVHRVECGGATYALKISDDTQPLADWRRGVHVRELAAEAGLSPRIVHVDESCRAVVSEFVADRSFTAFYFNPATHDAALAQLGRTVRRLHEIALPQDASSRDGRAFLAEIWLRLAAAFTVPEFVSGAVRGILDFEPPAREREVVLSHNDLNPSNLVYDGEHLFLLDWETVGANDPFHDLATLSVFLRMDEGTCAKLLSAYDDVPVSTLSERFRYHKRLVAVMCGAMFLELACRGGRAGATGDETLEATPDLGELYARMRSGALRIASAEGQWWFGLALVKASFA